MLEAVLTAELAAGKNYIHRAQEAEAYGDKGSAVQLEDIVRDETGHSEETERMLRDWPLKRKGVNIMNSRRQLIKASILLAAFISFLLSVYLWFSGSESQGIFVGIWVPSILSFGTLIFAGGGQRE